MFQSLFRRQGIRRYRRYLGARYNTFLYAFEHFASSGGKVVVELGTTRSFVHSRRFGAMVNDSRLWDPAQPATWDWGAGLFTRMCALHLEQRKPEIHTVDISPDALEISKVITAEFAPLISYHLMTSEEFLSAFDRKIDLLYMDAGETSTGADELHLREAKIVVERQLLSPGAIILIDDVNIPGTTGSKGRFSIPYFRSHGFEVVLSGYQVILQTAQRLRTGRGAGAAAKWCSGAVD